MERIKTILEKLNEQLCSGAPADQLMISAQMLHSELSHIISSNSDLRPASVAINMPPQAAMAPQPEKIVEVLNIEEEAVAAELEELRRNMEVRTRIAVQSKPEGVFEEKYPEEMVITENAGQSRHKEVNEVIAQEKTASLNDRFNERATELANVIQEPAIRDLRKAIGVNDRFLFINELFRGDETFFDRSIKTINSFAVFAEAELWVRKELKLALGWDSGNEMVKQFDQLLRRRFS
jgi:hypothetical protein